MGRFGGLGARIIGALLGTVTPFCNCSRMFQDTIDLAAENNLAADIQHVTDIKEVMKFGVMSLPGLVINDKVVSYGRILSKADIKKALEL